MFIQLIAYNASKNNLQLIINTIVPLNYIFYFCSGIEKV